MNDRNRKYEFASDNTAGLCLEALEALVRANAGICASYGEDEWTDEATQLFRDLFECDCDVYFVFNGTAANSLALASLCQSYHSVIAHERAHIETDECGAPEFFSNGTKILLTPGEGGKLDLEKAEELIGRRKDIHFPKPKVISLTQPSELGTVYSPQELRKVGDLARKYELRVHMDGARFAQAVAALNIPPRAISWEQGSMCFASAVRRADLASAKRDFQQRVTHLQTLRDRLHQGILSRIPEVKLNGHPMLRLANTLDVSFLYVEGESLLLNMNLEGIAASSGSACTAGSLEPSHVLLAMGVPPEVAQGAIRFSLGWENTDEDIDYVLEVLPQIVRRLRDISPLYQKRAI